MSPCSPVSDLSGQSGKGSSDVKHMWNYPKARISMWKPLLAAVAAYLGARRANMAIIVVVIALAVRKPDTAQLIEALRILCSPRRISGGRSRSTDQILESLR